MCCTFFFRLLPSLCTALSVELCEGRGPRDISYGCKILTDIAEHKSPDTSAGDIVYKHVNESAQI